jgi:uridine kinase
MKSRPILIAIVGGSGSGKGWLSEGIEKSLDRPVTRVSLDDFYRDQSHLTAAKRARLNFDHPRLIDWNLVEGVVRECRDGRPVSIPCYCFVTHTRKPAKRKIHPEHVVLFDGLWWLRRPAVRRLFDLTVFIDCSERRRFQQRLQRDIALRGRDAESVRLQFHTTVAPMHRKFVDPQSRWADVVIRQPMGTVEIARVARLIQKISAPGKDLP